MTVTLDDPHTVPTKFWHGLPDGRLQCDVCPRACKLREGQRGLCFVRARIDDQIVLTSYGRSSGFCVDPIEKKPLNHFLPGSAVLSFGTAGCNLACKFCQNWDISKSREIDTLSGRAGPDELARAAEQLGCRSIAFTYNDPTIFFEYAADVADACHERGIKAIAVTAGYMCPAPRAEFFRHIDAANIDLKAFTEDFYHRVCVSHLADVLDTLIYLRHETDVWFEITTLLIPGHNDSDAEIAAESDWIRRHLGEDIPLHFTAFHPDYKMRDVPPTPAATLSRARRIAMEEGLRYVYTGNVHDADGGTTSCPSCGAAVVVRDWYEIRRYELTDDGRCQRCGTTVPGVYDGPVGRWGGRRLPVLLE
ncbi:AmmeMemoRadiSam system radical SAM enzyme [Gordonia rhizosphera]|uniref:Putative PflA homolog n=1 Tax=Gordonia rhizosphera NBRC 16068 TaxID=1108045 RepID=K6X2Q5_9ACTN|nr:AmmeMemoRadiSam system radical SAM enzyme [Gordonia rhizosphera]GAB93089.1 putative PflA homolog [Gordonia rhizosphera NBRC 16068]